MPVQPHSSADAYAQRQDSRPCSSLSMLSGSNEIGESPRMRDANLKRGSVLSFQTALSGGSMSGYRSNDELSVAATGLDSAELEHLDSAAPPKPWLLRAHDGATGGRSSATSAYSSSHDDFLPGGWRSRNWNGKEGESAGYAATPVADVTATTLPAGSSALAGTSRRVPSHSPVRHLSPLVDGTDRFGSSPSMSAAKGGWHTPDQSISRSPPQSAFLPRINPSPLLDVDSISPSAGSPLTPQLTPQARMLSPSSAAPAFFDTMGMGATDTSDAVRSNDTLAAPRRQGTFSTVTPETNTREAEPAAAADHTRFPSAPQSATPRTRSPAPPTVPEKVSPPLPSKDKSSRPPSSPPLSEDDVKNIPMAQVPTLPVAHPPPARRPSQDPPPIPTPGVRSPVPISRPQNTERRTSAPLSVLPYGMASATANVGGGHTRDASMPIGAGVGAHKIRMPSNGERSPAFAAMMRNNSNGNPMASVATAAAGVSTMDQIRPTSPRTDDQPDVETPPREPSPPPEGEVEARAEWERTQMRRLAEQSKAKTAVVSASRKQTFRGQLKPLQLVAAEEAKQQARRSSMTMLSSSTARKSPELPFGALAGSTVLEEKAIPETPAEPVPANAEIAPKALAANELATADKTPSSGDVLSTQQLQKMSARDSKLTASAIHMPGGVTEVGGAYPVFTSPQLNSAARNLGGAKQYPGLMPQRSLVPPFELQNRPDGLPSALIGPDGVRRSPNDPDVCLECMMRDEDMIDVHVLGAGLWERESDRAFEDACRLDMDEPRSPSEQASHTGSATVENAGQTPTSSADKGLTKTRLTKIRVKRVAKGDPLTAEALKLHTQMNPPASSHRWRTLQTFLAIQAKYIAMDQRARGIPPAQSLPSKQTQTAEYDNTMVRTASGDSRRANVLSQLVSIDERSPLSPHERMQKEKDIALAREARRRNAAASASEARMAAGSRASLSQGASPIVQEDGTPTLDEELLKRPGSAQILAHENSSGHQSIPRRNNATGVAPLPSYMRAGTSAQDLRSVPHAMHKMQSADLPPSPASALVPPTPPFRSSTPQGLSNRGLRNTSSQMSLMQSGSMVDMHIGTEDRKDHRISQAGFLPGTPLHATSPSAFNRAYYGFPGDSDEPAGNITDARANSAMVNAFASQDNTMTSNGMGADVGVTRDAGEKKQKKKGGSGFRGLLNKLSGKDASAASAYDEGRGRMDGENEGSPRKDSVGADGAMRIDTLQPNSRAGGLLNRARRSTSSLLDMSRRASTDGSTMLNDRLGLPVLQSPAMVSQTSIDMGPFGSGPLPPPRTQSRDPPSLEQSRARTVSTGNLFSRRKAPDLSALPVSSFGNGADSQQRYSRSPSTGPRLSLTPGTLPLQTSGDSGMQQKGAGAWPPGYRKSNLSEAYNQQDDGMRAGSALGSLPDRQSALIGNGFMQGPWQGQMHGEHQSSQVQYSDPANTSTSSGRPKRPARNPHRGTPSQPASEHTASELNSGSKAASPLTNIRRLSEAGPATYANAPIGNAYLSRPVSELPAFMHTSLQAQTSRSPAMYNNASTPILTEAMQAFPGTADGDGMMNDGQAPYSGHVRSGSFGDNLTGYQADESFNSQRSRALSAVSPVTNPSRRSRLLKLPFGKNKRESTATLTGNSVKANGSVGLDGTASSLKSRSSRGTFDDWANANGGAAASSYAGRPPSMQQGYPAAQMAEGNDFLMPANGNSQAMYAEPAQSTTASGLKPWLRNRRGSNNFEERSGNSAALPPRSQSALGMLDANKGDDDDSTARAPSGGKRGLLPRFRTASRNALRSVDED